MKKEIREKMPIWLLDTEHGKFELCITDDLDSLFSAVILKDSYDWKINHFYNFTELYRIQKTDKKVICLDMAVEGERYAWDNHVTRFHANDIYNPNSANINQVLGINRNNYYDKYAGSTLLQIISYYKPFDLHSLSDEQKAVLWAIDSSADGYYSRGGRYRSTHAEYIELLQLEPIADVLEKYTWDELYDVKKKYGLNEKIYINKGKLDTKIDLQSLGDLFLLDFTLPSETFDLVYQFDKPVTKELSHKRYEKSSIEGLFSLALTGKDKVKYTQIS